MSDYEINYTKTPEPEDSIPEHTGRHVYRVWLSPSGETIDVRADRSEIRAVDNNSGPVLGLWVDEKRKDGTTEISCVFLAAADTFLRCARLDTLVQPEPVTQDTIRQARDLIADFGDAVYTSAATKEH